VIDKLLRAFEGLLDSMIAAAPKVLVGFLLIMLGIGAAKLVEIVLRFLMTRLHFDRIMKTAGVDRALERLGVTKKLDVFLPRLAYFLVLFVLAKTAADALSLSAISDAIGAFFAYVPNIVAALLLLILGSSAGQFAGETVAQAAEASGIEFASSLGRFVSGLVIFVVAMMAVAELKIDTGIVRIVTSFVLGGAALAFGVSFGLGTWDVIRNVTAGFYARRFLEVGKRLEISGEQGVLRSVTATHTILEDGERKVSISNATFLEQVAKQES
jgi:hypothetical protein